MQLFWGYLPPRYVTAIWQYRPMYCSLYTQALLWVALAALGTPIRAAAERATQGVGPAAGAAPATVPAAAGAAVPLAGVPMLEEIRIALPPELTAASVDGAPASTREFARCSVLVWITADGTIRAGQVIDGSGSARLDALALAGVMGRRVQPAREADRAVDSWAVLPFVWTGAGASIDKLSRLALRARPPGPVLAHDQALHLEPPYYPSGALEHHVQGDCTVQVRISDTGHLEDLRVVRSTGSADLDAGCLAALYAAHFIPARHAGRAIEGSTEVMLHWAP